MANLARTPPSRISEILQSCDEGKLLQKLGHKKHPGANAIISYIKCTSIANKAQHFAANRGSQSARKAELWQIWQGHPHRAFSEILQSCDQGKLLRKLGHKKHLGANTIISYIKCTSIANKAQHFAANRGSQMARKAELWQIWQGHPHRAFSEILQSCDQGKLLRKLGHKKHLGANAIIS